VETRDNIEFENSDKNFDLVQTFPMLSLKEKYECLIIETWPDSNQETLHIREL